VSAKVTLPRRAKGERPYFFDDPAIDQLHSLFLALSAELSVAYDRIDTLERLLEQKGLVPRADIEAFRPDDAVEGDRAARRNEYLQRIFRIFRDQREGLAKADRMPQYERTIAELGGDTAPGAKKAAPAGG
jgi:hypothetical protein